MINTLVLALLVFNTAFNICFAYLFVTHVRHWEFELIRSVWLGRVEGVALMQWQAPVGDVPNETVWVKSFRFRKERKNEYEIYSKGSGS